MKKKITMICILKSGITVKDITVRHYNKAVQNITFGNLTVAVSEIAAIKFKEN